MKTTILNLFAASLAAIIILGTSCKKNDNNQDNPVVTLSKSTVKIGEPVIATTNSNEVVRWSVKESPTNTWISSSKNKSAIIFSIPGTYAVTANYFLDSTAASPYVSSSSSVIVTDSIYNHASDAHLKCLAILENPLNSDEQITLTPVSYTNNGLVLVAHTLDTYGAFFPILAYTQMSDITTGYGFSFSNILTYPCDLPHPSGIELPGTASITFGGNNHPLQNGESDVTFNLNGTIYKGTLTVTSTSCTFNWNYTTGVTISPLIIQKQ